MQFSAKDCPPVGLWIVHFDRTEPVLPIVTAEHVDFSLAYNCSKRAPWGIQRLDSLPLLPENIVSLASGHTFILTIIPTDHINLPVEVDTAVFLPGIAHAFLLLEYVGVSGAE